MPPLAATPATLAPHGTLARAQVCSKHCRVCSPAKVRMRGWWVDARERATAASHEGKRLRGRI